MLSKIKNNVEKQLEGYARRLGRKTPGALRIPRLIDETIIDFIRRPGKRIRPVLLVIGYLAYCPRPRLGIYRSAVGLELLHDFLLIHDDIIDRTAMRKGKPTMHCQLQQRLSRYPRLKFNGADLATVIADIIYARALEEFCGGGGDPRRTQAALATLLRTTALTGYGEAAELLAETRDLAGWTREDVFAIYDLKTAYYTFCSPLCAGSQLAGAHSRQVRNLERFGMLVGRAFQIKDDLLDMFATEKEIGKTPLTDLKEGKKTLLVWYAYTHSSPAVRQELRRTLAKPSLQRSDCLRLRRIISDSGAQDYAREEINRLRSQAENILAALAMKPAAKQALSGLTSQILAG